MNKFTDVQLTTADFLLQIKAIKLNNENPFTWASGRKSPIYCDNRVTLSYPMMRTYIRQQFVKYIQDEYGVVEVIAGVATGGIAHGALVAQDLGLPFVYVRSEEKKHGLTNQVEGKIDAGQSVLIIEDLVSTGKSSLNAATALKEAGCKVLGMLAIFTYGLDVAQDAFKKADVPLFTLTNYDALIHQAAEKGYIYEGDLESLATWRQDPAKWSEDRMK